MGAVRKSIGRFVCLNTAAADTTGATVTAAASFTYDPNPIGSYDPTVQAVQEISVTPSVAFTAAAASFKLQVQQYNSSGATVGAAIVLWDGTATSGVAFTPINANPSPTISLTKGDTLSFDFAKAGAGSNAIPRCAITLFIGAKGA